MQASAIEFPPTEEVLELMHGLFDLEIKSLDGPTGEMYSIAAYKNDAGEILAYVACDLAGGCRMGAALTQVPAGRVDEAVGEGVMPENLAENLEEVFNICVNLVVPSDGARVVFSHCAHDNGDADFDTLWEKIESLSKHEVCFDIARYGRCGLVIAS